jgi:flagellar export protein FliJ
MKSLATLIRLKKQQVDELRRGMVRLEEQKQVLLDQHTMLANQLRHELELAGQLPELAGFFGDFAGRIRRQQEELMEKVAALDAKIVQLRDQIAEAFSEMKKYEIAKEQRLAKQRETQARREGLAMDEIAQQQHLRKQRKEE